MATGSVIAMGAAAGIVKRILDDLYGLAKSAAINQLTKSRSDLREAAIAKALTAVTRIKTLWNVEKEVSLYDFYYPSKVDFPGGVTKQISSLRELGSGRGYVLQGTAGQGKSVFLRYLAGQELFTNETSNRIPIFVELRRLRTDLTLVQLILQALEKYKLPHGQESWPYLAGTGKFVLLLDAFDEIDPGIADRAISDIEAIADLYEKLQIIITSRPEADIQRSSRFRVLRLAPLDNQDHQPFLQRICPDQDQAASLAKVLASSTTDIKGLLTTPLMLTLLVILYKSLQTIPDTLPKFYEELFDVLFYRHDHSKPGFRRKRYTQLDDSKVKKLFAAVCFVARLQGLGTLTSTQLRECVAKAGTACNESVDPDKFRDELTKTVCLMLQDGLEYSFIHKSVTQYYAASFVRGSSEAFAEKFYALASKEDSRGRWDLELRFLAEIDTYRFMKWRQLPLLKRCANNIDYSFESASPLAQLRLNEHMFQKISLISRRAATERSQDRAFKFVGWSHPIDDDPIVEVLADLWGGRLFQAVGRKEFSDKLLAASPRPKKQDDNEIREKAEAFQKLILAELPNLALDCLAELQRRYEHAVAIVSAEEQKSEMLSNLLE